MRRFLRKISPRFVTKIVHLIEAVLALLWFRNPSKHMTVIGVTGTDGKTTTAYMLYEILKAADRATTLITSVGVIMHGEADTRPTGLHATTPPPFETQRILSEALANGTEIVILETTSHGLEQFRVFGVNYDIGVVTNVTNEHLDYHKTWENYVAAKGKLLRHVSLSVLNKDDRSYQPMVTYAGDSHILTYSLDQEADLVASNVDMVPERVSFDVNTMQQRVTSRLIGWYNIHNMLAAVGVVQHLGIGDDAIVKGLGGMAPPPGRLQLIDEGQAFTVIVDFAHTSNGLDSVLKMLNDIKTHRLIVVFGCAGERDPFKRHPMGVSAGKYADLTVITAEDPRSEDLQTIMEEIAVGVEEQGGLRDQTYFMIGDRYEAIQYAIRELAQPGDIVVTTGKAHEQSMNYDGITETPWDEFGAVRDALHARLATPTGG